VGLGGLDGLEGGVQVPMMEGLVVLVFVVM